MSTTPLSNRIVTAAPSSILAHDLGKQYGQYVNMDQDARLRSLEGALVHAFIDPSRRTDVRGQAAAGSALKDCLLEITKGNETYSSQLVDAYAQVLGQRRDELGRDATRNAGWARTTADA